jgi:predicted transport protein
MPLFQINNKILASIRPKEFALEKELQSLIEGNLKTVFNCQFIASEFPTGSKHAGRIDTLALSEENNPVIIEYKKNQSSELVNQGLYYLSWIHDHKGDFQVAVENKLGKKTEIDWSDIRVICIAPDYKKFDLYAVQVMGANIELWKYRYYDNGAFFLEEVFKRSGITNGEHFPDNSGKNPIMVEAGKKAALTRKTGVYNFEDHAKNAQGELINVVHECRDFITGLSESIEEVPKKLYVAYKVAQNFVCMEVHREKFYLYLKADLEELKALPRNGRDVRKIGHFGTGDLELTISSLNDLEVAKAYIKRSLERVGGG